MGILSGNPKNEPMHYGEVISAWMFLFSAQGLYSGYQLYLNHAGDKDLQKLIEESIEQTKNEIEKVEELLKENGIGIPPSAPERPKAMIEEIPVGAKFADQEIATTMAKDNALGLVECSKIIGQCIREDIAAIFVQFHTQKVALGGKFLRLIKEKGWLIPPPLHLNKHDVE